MGDGGDGMGCCGWCQDEEGALGKRLRDVRPMIADACVQTLGEQASPPVETPYVASSETGVCGGGQGGEGDGFGGACGRIVRFFGWWGPETRAE